MVKIPNLIFFLINIMIVNLSAQSALDYIARGDEYKDRFEIQKALEEYKSAFKADSSNCKTLWKIAESHIDLGEEADEILQRQHYYVAEKWAKKTVSKCPNEPNAHFFIAVSSGLLALYEGGKQKVRRSKEIKIEAERTLQLDPQHHGAYHVLGRWHRELANLSWFLKAMAKIIYGGIPPGASNEGAVENFKKAIELAPQWVNHYKELGLTYMETEKWDEARNAFEQALTLPISDHQDEMHKRDCKKLLKKLEKKP